jgi:hypothetical protein
MCALHRDIKWMRNGEMSDSLHVSPPKLLIGFRLNLRNVKLKFNFTDFPKNGFSYVT